MAFKLRTLDGSFFASFVLLAERLNLGAGLLAQILNDDADRHTVADELATLKVGADEIAAEVIRRTNRMFVTPIDREDLYRLTTAMAEIMEQMAGVADLVEVYQVRALPKQFADLVDPLQRCAEATVAAMPRLHGRADLVDYWIEIRQLESRADRIHRRISADLLDGSRKAIEATKLLRILDATEDVVDGFRKVADAMELIVVKES